MKHIFTYKNLKIILLTTFFYSLYSCSEDSLEKALSNPKRVKEIDLINQNITSLPSDISKLNNIEKLYLNRNQIKSLPNVFFHLNKLKILNLNDNLLDSLPKSIGNLNQLESLSLINNKLTKLPESISKLNELKYLNLSNNPISFEERVKIIKLLPNVEIHFEYASQLNDPVGFFNSALKEYNNNNQSAAIYFCAKAIELRPDYTEALSLKGFLECYNGNIGEGCNDLKKAVELGDKQAGNFLKQFCK